VAAHPPTSRNSGSNTRPLSNRLFTVPPRLGYFADRARVSWRLAVTKIWAIKQPTEHRSLLVISGQQGVFLPVPNDPRSLEELARSLGARANEPVHYTFTGDMFPWPSRPEHLLDPAPVTP
jgi:hypothetical protein